MMHKSIAFIPAAALAVLLSACALQNDAVISASAASAASADPAHSSRSALDWAGSYEGVTPCADCPGIELRLTLMADDRYELTTRYLERQVMPETVQGRFRWSADGGSIALDEAGYGQRFRVGEGRLLQLNQDGSAPSWNAPYRVLKRVESGNPGR